MHSPNDSGCNGSELLSIKRVKLQVTGLLSLTILIVLSGCGPKTVPVRDSISSDFPENGYKMYLSPQGSDEIGKVIGEDKDGVRSYIRNLGLPLPEPKPLDLPQASRDIEISAMAGANLIFGSEFTASSNVKGSIKISVQGAQKQIYDDDQVQKALLVVTKDPADSIFSYKRYSVIKEVITGIALDYEISEDTVRSFGGQAGLESPVFKAKIQGTYERDEKTVYTLRNQYTQPMTIFFKEKEFDPNEVLSIKEKLGIYQPDGTRMPVTKDRQTRIALGIKPLVAHLKGDWRPGLLVSGELNYDKILKYFTLFGELGGMHWQDTVSYSTLPGSPDGSFEEKNSLWFFNLGFRKYFRLSERADLYGGLSGGTSHEFDKDVPYFFTGSVLAGVALYPQWDIRTTFEVRWIRLKVREREVDFNAFGDAKVTQEENPHSGLMSILGIEKTF